MSDTRLDIIKELRAVAKRSAMIPATHFPECWKYHWPCAIEKALEIIDELDPV